MMLRDYSRAFHTSIKELGEMRLYDFLINYAEAAEEVEKDRENTEKLAAKRRFVNGKRKRIRNYR